jgi:hypothetical protein
MPIRTWDEKRKLVATKLLPSTLPLTLALRMALQKPSAAWASPCLSMLVPVTKYGVPLMRTARSQPALLFMANLHWPQDASTI